MVIRCKVEAWIFGGPESFNCFDHIIYKVETFDVMPVRRPTTYIKRVFHEYMFGGFGV